MRAGGCRAGGCRVAIKLPPSYSTPPQGFALYVLGALAFAGGCPMVALVGSSEPNRVPLPLRVYRKSVPDEPPAAETSWRFLMTEPPYNELRQVGRLDDLARLRMDAARPPRGCILVATSDHGVAPVGHFSELRWIRSALPWCPLVVAGFGPTTTTLLAKYVTRLSRRGAVLLPNPMESLSADRVARAVGVASEASLDLDQWLGLAAPDWPHRARRRAVEEFALGFGSKRLDGQRRPSRQGLWVRVGRAMGAARVIQMNSGEPASKLAHEAGYADFRSMDRALLRLFGVYTRQIRSTVGWEWLLWRFLCLRGDGKELRWDQ